MTHQFQYDAGKYVTKAFPAAGANANCDTIDLGAASYRRIQNYIGVWKFPVLDNLVATKVVTVTLQESDDDVTYAATNPSVIGTITGKEGNGHAAGQIEFPIPSETKRYVQLNVSVPGDAGNLTASYYNFGLGFWK